MLQGFLVDGGGNPFAMPSILPLLYSRRCFRGREIERERNRNPFDTAIFN